MNGVGNFMAEQEECAKSPRFAVIQYQPSCLGRLVGLHGLFAG